MFAFLSYLAVSNGSYVVFNWFLHLTTIANLFTWVGICLSSIGFRRALKAQGVTKADMPFHSPFQPYLAYISLAFFVIVIVFNGFHVFTTGNFNATDFITAYIGIPIFAILFLFWKILKRTKMVDPKTADIWTGKAAIDAEYWPERFPRNFLERIWFWIA